MARNYIYFKSGKANLAVRGVRKGESGGNAGDAGALEALAKLGYKNYTIGTNLTKAQFANYQQKLEFS
jgi:hypothetical protein